MTHRSIQNHLLVQGGRVVDGTGSPPVRADVRIADGRVVEIGPDLRPDGERVVDADQAFVAPGFIDSHTHFDASLFWDASCDPMPQHGVTSVVIGNCGLSLAPLVPQARKELVDVFAYIEDLPVAAFDSAVPWTWEGVAGWREALAERSPSVNVASFVGMIPLRLSVMGTDAWERPATPDERRQLAELLDASMAAGAIGLSTSFFDTDATGRPVPSRAADDDELAALFDVLASRSGVFEFLPDLTIRDRIRDIERVAAIAGPRGVTCTFNGLYHESGRPDRVHRMLDRCDEMLAGGVSMHPQFSPRSLEIRVNWNGGMAFYNLAETWHRVLQADADGKRRLLSDDSWRASARAEWDATRPTLFPYRSPELIKLRSAVEADDQRWVGRLFADLLAERGGHPSDAMADWVLANDLNPDVIGMAANTDPAGIAEAMAHPSVVISNSDAGAHLQMMAATGDTTLLLTRHVRDRGDLTVEAAVHHLTARQSAVFGLGDRGVLAPGRPADIAVFALEEMHFDDEEFVNDVPGGTGRMRRPAGGVRTTIVNGDVVQQQGVLTGAGPGTMLGT